MMLDNAPLAISPVKYECVAREVGYRLSIGQVGKRVGAAIDRHVTEDLDLLRLDNYHSRIGPFTGILEIVEDCGGIGPDCLRGRTPNTASGSYMAAIRAGFRLSYAATQSAVAVATSRFFSPSLRISPVEVHADSDAATNRMNQLCIWNLRSRSFASRFDMCDWFSEVVLGTDSIRAYGYPRALLRV
jgi:hypothetical protein